MFPFAPPPGQFIGNRPTVDAPDGSLADDDRKGIRFSYPDPSDSLNAGSIRGQILPANSFALATFAWPSAGSSVTGIVGLQVVRSTPTPAQSSPAPSAAGGAMQQIPQRVSTAASPSSASR
jgi:hypothetical protein